MFVYVTPATISIGIMTLKDIIILKRTLTSAILQCVKLQCHLIHCLWHHRKFPADMAKSVQIALAWHLSNIAL